MQVDIPDHLIAELWSAEEQEEKALGANAKAAAVRRLEKAVDALVREVIEGVKDLSTERQRLLGEVKAAGELLKKS